jgi:hypothetical protein
LKYPGIIHIRTLVGVLLECHSSEATKNPPVDGGLIHSLQIITKPLACVLAKWSSEDWTLTVSLVGHWIVRRLLISGLGYLWIESLMQRCIKKCTFSQGLAKQMAGLIDKLIAD